MQLGSLMKKKLLSSRYFQRNIDFIFYNFLIIFSGLSTLQYILENKNSKTYTFYFSLHIFSVFRERNRLNQLCKGTACPGPFRPWWAVDYPADTWYRAYFLWILWIFSFSLLWIFKSEFKHAFRRYLFSSSYFSIRVWTCFTFHIILCLPCITYMVSI